MIKVFILDVYALLDLGESLSFITPYDSNNFYILPQKLCEPFYVSTLVWEFILAERVYRDSVISTNHKDTMTDLIELDMLDFNVILGIDWIHVCCASTNCRNQVVKFLPNEPVLEWRSGLECQMVILFRTLRQ